MKVRFCGTKHVSSGWASTAHFTHCISVFFSLTCFLFCLVLAPFSNLITGFTVSLRLRSVWPGLTQAACRQQNDFWFVFDSYSGDEPLMTRWLVFAMMLRIFKVCPSSFPGRSALWGSCATSLGVSSSQKTCTKVRAQTSLSNRKLEKGNSTILDKLRVTIRAATPWGIASKLKKLPKTEQIPLVFAAKCFVAWVLILCLPSECFNIFEFLIRTFLGFEATNGVAKRSPWHTLTHKIPLTLQLLHQKTFTPYLSQPFTPKNFFTPSAFDTRYLLHPTLFRPENF